MAEYQSGIETKALIYNASKHLFYENGLDGTSFSMIGSATGVNKSLISYHFKSKANLARAVYEEFLDSFQTWLYSDLIHEEFGVAFSCASIVLFRFTCSNLSFRRFYNEMKNSPDLSDFSYEIQNDLIRRIAEAYHIDISNEDLITLSCMYEGVERSLISGVCAGRITQDPEQVVHRDMTFVFSSFGFCTEKIEQMFADGLALASRYRIHMEDGFAASFAKH